MKLDVNSLRYLTKAHFRVLTAIEMGMRNHELVPMQLVESIAKVRTGGVHKLMGDLLRNSLVHRDRSKYEGYRLTYMGYDYLALHTFVARGTITGLGRQIGVGKESDIYLAVDGEGRQMALKLHRLGRISFRNVRNKRDYMRNRQAKPGSWLYLSRLACLKEYAFMTALHDHEFPVPEPIDQNRHAILMSLCEGFPMTQVRHVAQPEVAYSELMELILRLARCGLIHGDFNEYNLILGYDEKITLIDFPQMISTNHPNAQIYFDRDCQGVADFFRSRLGYHGSELPLFTDIGAREINLDQEVQASGFSEEHKQKFNKLMSEQTKEMGEEEEEEQQGQNDDEMAVLKQETDGDVTRDVKAQVATEGETKGEVTGSDSVITLDVVSLISKVSEDEESERDVVEPGTSFLDQASRTLDKEETSTTSETARPTTNSATPIKLELSAEEIKEKVRRSMRQKKGGKGKKGGSKSKKNQNKNRDKRRLMTQARNDR
jgi:RIO kinase 2